MPPIWFRIHSAQGIKKAQKGRFYWGLVVLLGFGNENGSL